MANNRVKQYRACCRAVWLHRKVPGLSVLTRQYKRYAKRNFNRDVLSTLYGYLCLSGDVKGKGEATEFPSPPRRLRGVPGTEAGVLWEEPQWRDELRKVLESSRIQISQKLPGTAEHSVRLASV